MRRAIPIASATWSRSRAASRWSLRPCRRRHPSSCTEHDHPQGGAVMADLIQLIVSGTATGAIYALAALGFTLLWQASGTINFAQGEFVMLPAFVMLFFLGPTVGAPLWLAFLLTCLVSMLLLGYTFKLVVVDPL